jgi:Mg-chelatase subunit ChlD
MDRELARLAEEAADDLALSEVEDREEYAAILLDITLEAAAHRRTLSWGVSSMAREANAIQRINRILSRRLKLPKPLGPFAWATLLAFSLPVIYLSSAVKLASANRDSRVSDQALVRGSDQTGVIVSIRVHGNRSVPTDAILAHVSTLVGDPYVQPSIERTFKSLWNTGFFEEIRMQREAAPEGWVIHIYVRERPRIQQNTPRGAEQKSSTRHIAQASSDPRPPMAAQEDTPLTMCILVDNSGSMRDHRAALALAAMALVKASKPQDEVGIVHFNDEMFSGLPNGEDFTSNVNEMEEAIRHIDSRGGSAMRDAVQKSIDQVQQKAHHQRKVLVLVTDGNDTSSVMTQDQLLGEVKSSGVRVYSIGLLSEKSGQAAAARLALGQLAEASGGGDYYPKKVAEGESFSHAIQDQARRQ